MRSFKFFIRHVNVTTNTFTYNPSKANMPHPSAISRLVLGPSRARVSDPRATMRPIRSTRFLLLRLLVGSL